MAVYQVHVRQTVQHFFLIEAPSKEMAEAKVDDYFGPETERSPAPAHTEEETWEVIFVGPAEN